MSPYVGYLLLRNFAIHTQPSQACKKYIGGIKWWKKRYRHREGSNQEPYALKAYALTARIKPGTAALLLIRIVFSDSNKLTLFITKVFGYRPGNNSSAFNVSTHEGAGTFQALANKELTSPKANWASRL
ncbi:hypothetical protein H8356DRAFT_1418317 [Neocallimastix lanati (nom. inval.)]|nr:hypothetical protein H8356DRAFT_1418317 [Neocallimastix sp. JGI-2020a]